VFLYTFVTILVDKIDFADIDPKHDADIRLSGHVSWVGKSSIEVVVWLEQKRVGKWRKLARALFLVASRDPTNSRAAVVNPLQFFSSLISMSAHVLYTELNYMEIVVLAEILDPITGSLTTSNSFYYTYSISEWLPQVIPKTYHEAIWYIDGRRKFRSMIEEQQK
jgi:hypothetical protein